MTTLYIIGNGFDLFHGLATSTDAFRALLDQRKLPDGAHSALDEFEMCGVDWGELENSLAHFELSEAEAANVLYPDYLSEREADRDGTIHSMECHLASLEAAVEDALCEMVDNANNELCKVDCRARVSFRTGDAVVSFNYTSTLERLYKISDGCDVLHIHGLRENGDELIFGYKDPIMEGAYRTAWFTGNAYDGGGYERDYYIDSQRSLLMDFYLKWKKPYQEMRLEGFLERQGEINEVVVLGHSLSAVDQVYMETIDEVLKPERWFISQHEGRPSLDELTACAFRNRVVFFAFDQLAENHIDTIMSTLA